MKEHRRRGSWLGAIRVMLTLAMTGDVLYLLTITRHRFFYVATVPLDPSGHDLPPGNNLYIGEPRSGFSATPPANGCCTSPATG